MSKKESFNIRNMIELTGLSEFTIRGWENRYQAFTPKRGGTGRREYTKSDVEKALLLRELLKRGHKIGKIAELDVSELQRLFYQGSQDTELSAPSRREALITQTLEMVALQKWSALEEHVQNLRFRSAREMVEDFFLPLLRSLAQQIQQGLVSIAQEHVLSAYLKERIYAAISKLDREKTAIKSPVRFVLAAPEGDYHDIGLLLAHLLIRSSGFKTLFLGPHTPPHELAETSLRFNATHILIVSTVSKKDGAKLGVLSYLAEVRKKIGTQTQLFIAGPQAPLSAQATESAITIVPSFEHLMQELEKLGGNRL